MDCDNNEYEDEEIEGFLCLQAMLRQIYVVCSVAIAVVHVALDRYFRNNQPILRGLNRLQAQIANINRLVRTSDEICIEQLRMDRRCFMHLCQLVESRGLSHSRFVPLEEKVAMFLYVLAHHHKNRVIKHDFLRSGQTVRKYFNDVLKSILRLQGELLQTPAPITEGCTDRRWNRFQNCLGALDGTYIKVRVCKDDAARYRTRKGEIATNMLGVCSQDMMFIYVLSGWEGSVADGRVLRDAVTRRNGLKVPIGHYYLVDAGYTNGEGFLAPYRGQRYHLSEWRDGAIPASYQEYFNMKHASARNVIERCFGLLKMRWAILRSPSYFPIKSQCRIMTACCLLHNLIRREMTLDPLEAELDEAIANEHDIEDEYIDTVETSDHWTNWRDVLATQMYNDFLANRG